jgi:hypothetical protein
MRWVGGNDVALDASWVDAASSESMSGAGVVDRDNYPRIKAAIGVLAMIAAVTAAAGATMSASLFGALAALALSAAAALAALLELTQEDRYRSWRLGAWGALVPGWIACVVLLNAPLGHLDGLRVLISALIAGRVALQVSRWRAHQCSAPLGMAIALGVAPLALAATWSGMWSQMSELPVTAISIACALELFGTGSLWLAEALVAWRRPVAQDETPGLPAAASLQVA